MTTALKAFADELEKIATAHTKSLQEFHKALEPGDVLVTRPRSIVRLKDLFLRAGLVLAQGTPYTHAAMYVGDGKVVDSGDWGGPSGVREVGLQDFAHRYKVRALRVHATPKERQEAAAFAKKQVGKDFNMLGMLRLALPASNKGVARARAEVAKEKLFCSELVAHAYPATSFGGRAPQHVRPVDIDRSSNTRRVVELR